MNISTFCIRRFDRYAVPLGILLATASTGMTQPATGPTVPAPPRVESREPASWEKRMREFQRRHQQETQRQFQEAQKRFRKLFPDAALDFPLPPTVAAPKTGDTSPHVISQSHSRDQAISWSQSGEVITGHVKENGVTFTLKGRLNGNKIGVTAIELQEGGKTQRYQNLGQVPESHRPRIRGFLATWQKELDLLTP